MKSMTLVLALAFLVYGQSSLACIVNSVDLNDATQLNAHGVYNPTTNQMDMDLASIENRVKKTGSAVINATDSKNQVTHKVVYLGSLKEDVSENGSTKTEIIQSAFLVKEIASGAERTVIFKTNYLGNGVRARASASAEKAPKQDQEFKTLQRTVCK